VLAAVVILAIWYVVIANAAIRGLGREGESLRFMEAAMLADNVLAEIEASTVDGTAPEHSQDTREEEPYTVTIKIAGLGGGGAGGFGARPLAPDSVTDGPPPDLAKLVSSEMPGIAAHLRTITVKVHWNEGEHERTVTRVTHAFDVAKAIEALYPEGEGGEGIPGDAPPTDDRGSADQDERAAGEDG
jgi:hypothetical protein